MKILELLTWIFGILAGILIILATIAFFFEVKFFGVVHIVNYFHVVNAFLLVAISCILFLQYWNKKLKKEE